MCEKFQKYFVLETRKLVIFFGRLFILVVLIIALAEFFMALVCLLSEWLCQSDMISPLS